MLEIFGLPIGTVSQLVTAIVAVSGAVWAFLRFGLGWRGQTLDAEELLRTHFANRLKVMDERMTSSEAAHSECLEDRDRLRQRVRELEDHLEGVYRMLVQTSAEKVIELGADFPPHVVELAKRTVRHTEAKRREKNGDRH